MEKKTKLNDGSVLCREVLPSCVYWVWKFTEPSLRRAESVSDGLYGVELAMKYNSGDERAISHYGWSSREYLQVSRRFEH